MKKKEPKLEIYIQSPLGGNITPEEIEAAVAAGIRISAKNAEESK